MRALGARRGIQARYKARSRRQLPRRRPRRPEASAAHMAPVCCLAGTLMLVYAGLLAAAASLGSPEPGAPSGSRDREEPPPGNELPAGPAALPSVRSRPTCRTPAPRRPPGLGLPAGSPHLLSSRAPRRRSGGGGGPLSSGAASRAGTWARLGVPLRKVGMKTA